MVLYATVALGFRNPEMFPWPFACPNGPTRPTSQAQKLVAQTQALAQLHCTIPRDASHLEKTQVPPVQVLHLEADIMGITGGDYWWWLLVVITGGDSWLMLISGD